jgi:hypothetical protein
MGGQPRASVADLGGKRHARSTGGKPAHKRLGFVKPTRRVRERSGPITKSPSRRDEKNSIGCASMGRTGAILINPSISGADSGGCFTFGLMASHCHGRSSSKDRAYPLPSQPQSPSIALCRLAPFARFSRPIDVAKVARPAGISLPGRQPH